MVALNSVQKERGELKLAFRYAVSCLVDLTVNRVAVGSNGEGFDAALYCQKVGLHSNRAFEGNGAVELFLNLGILLEKRAEAVPSQKFYFKKTLLFMGLVDFPQFSLGMCGYLGGR